MYERVRSCPSLDELRSTDQEGKEEVDDDDVDNVGESIRMLPLDDSGGDEESRPTEERSYETKNVDESIEDLISKVVPSTDDPSLPALTIRVLILGSVFCILGAASSQLFYFKSNPPSFSSYFVILASHPLGKFMAAYLPRKKLMGFSLNPGPFNIKEHLLIGVLAASGGSAAYASDILAILSLYYKTEVGAVAGTTLLLTTQLIGFGLSGLLMKILVEPPSCYWPNSLVLVSLYHTLHSKSNLTTSRLNFFMVVLGCTFMYQFLPAFLFPTLNSLPMLCLLSNPTTRVLRMLGSGYEGIGLLDFSLDWSSIGATSPLYTPWFSLLNYFGGLMGMAWIIVPIMWFTNFWDAQNFSSPVSAGLFTSSFTRFNVTSLLTPSLELNTTVWETSQPLLLTPYFALSYAFSFASLSSILTHVYLFYGHEIADAWSKRGSPSGAGRDDIHNRLMRAYPSVPQSWYIAMIVVNFIASATLVLTYPVFQTPLWLLLLALGIAVIFVVPIGIVSAVSGQTIGLNVLTEFCHGLLQPGKPVGNVFFKCFGYMAMSQALNLTSDLKIALYLKVSYRDMFKTQVLGTVIGALVNYVTLVHVIDAKRPFLDGTDVDPTGQWSGRQAAVFYSASIIWGLVAPRRFFSGKYWVLYLGFPIGVAVPVLMYYLHKKYPSRGFDKIVFPIICSGATLLPQLPANIILTGAMVSWLFHVRIARHHPRWSEKYTLTLSAALDAATSLNALAVYGLFTATFKGVQWYWWGNPRPGGDSEHCVQHRPAVEGLR
ncbi:Sexual differentiation process protein ISP4 [Phaffia rhodozyma]|uniref:Sexual differentiation process protein ISP4 n=1 Tax=Phaffia rhodozyma TaxID=264483 RepID=A0A0F7SRB1_PHARH|nr:Sexual differentiation process protein ISP4 [Phaffia rhodozyma]